MSHKNFVIFGASGDLAKKRLYPALFDLFLNDLHFGEYIGYGRTELTDEQFRDLVLDSLPKTKKSSIEKTSEFLKKFKYICGPYASEGLGSLKSSTNNEETTFYLSLPTTFELVHEILTGLEAHQLLNPDSKIVLEKPFGYNFQSAKKLNDLLLRHFKEQQIYRIDHYLAKDLVRDLFTLRFSNSIFNSLWNNRHIESIIVQIKETGLLENRGEFYDQTGAIRDVIQNHAIQLLALTVMDQPKDLSPKSIQNEKIKVLKKLRLFKNNPRNNIQIGQYQDFIRHANVKQDSLTETFALIHAEINSPTWRGVPITFLHGKKQDEQTTDIIIKFKSLKNCLWQEKDCPIENNELRINIQPQNDINLKLNFGYKISNSSPQPINLRFGFLDNQYIFKDAYENALKDVYNNDQSIFLSSAEILLSWQFIDPIIKFIDNHRAKLLTYYN